MGGSAVYRVYFVVEFFNFYYYYYFFAADFAFLSVSVKILIAKNDPELFPDEIEYSCPQCSASRNASLILR